MRLFIILVVIFTLHLSDFSFYIFCFLSSNCNFTLNSLEPEVGTPKRNQNAEDEDSPMKKMHGIKRRRVIDSDSEPETGTPERSVTKEVSETEEMSVDSNEEGCTTDSRTPKRKVI